MRRIQYILAGVVFTLSTATTISAQQTADDHPMILLSSQKTNVNYNDTTIHLRVKANTAIETSSDGNWLSATALNDSHYAINIKANWTGATREGTVKFKSVENSFTRTFTVSQAVDNVADLIPEDILIRVASATAVSQLEPDNDNFATYWEPVSKSYDNNPQTFWHSPWGDNSGHGDPKYFPIELTYNFAPGCGHMDYVKYTPRPSGTNGCFGKFELWYKTEGATEFTKQGDYDFNSANNISILALGPDGKGLDNPQAVRMIIKSGGGGFASCGEMGFYQLNSEQQNTDYEIFTDALMTDLRPGTTQADVDRLTNPLCKKIASLLLEGYDKQYRVASYPCLLSPFALSDLWSTPGKYYDRFEGVTGINISRGKHIVIADGIPAEATANLKVVAWYSAPLQPDPENTSALKGADPHEFSYSLKNGVNVFEYDFDYDGLAYVSYCVSEKPERFNDIRVHFVNGEINGYLTSKQTNLEIGTILQKAKNRCIDLLGSKCHSVWEAEAFLESCRDITGTKKGYVQYMNILDSLVDYEHYLLGFKKYDRVPKNRTMAYVNYTYYMFQSGYGVAFKYDTQSRVLNCRTIALNDADAIWGLSHEWGHQHQMSPYFCWIGMTEVTNNTNTCYNVLRMGYKGANDGGYSRILQQREKLRKTFVTDDKHAGTKGILNENTRSSRRGRAYERRNDLLVHEEYRRMAEEQAERGDTVKIPAWKEGGPVEMDLDHAVSYHEIHTEEMLSPLFMLHCYFANPDTAHRGDLQPDFLLDLYEALRQTEYPTGSQIEKTSTEPDKYELLACAHNGNKVDTYSRFVTKYPESCWIKNGYLTDKSVARDNSVPFIFHFVRKASMVCGYNLYPYFEKFGMFRTIVLDIFDYSEGIMALTPSMRDEFKADMDALVADGTLKPVDDDMVNRILSAEVLTYPRPDFPNEPEVTQQAVKN